MGQIPGSVRLTGFIAPTDSTDVYPVTDPKWGLGGLRSVSGATERDDITTERREAGMLVYSELEDTYFKLGTGLTNSDWEEFLTGDGGNYLSISGGTVTGDTYFTGNLSAGTIYSGSTDLYAIINQIAADQSSNYIPLSGNSSGTTIEGDLYFDDDTFLLWEDGDIQIGYDSVDGTLNFISDSDFDFQGGAILSAGTDLYDIFTTDADLVWSAGTATGSIQSKTGSTSSGNFSLSFGINSVVGGDYSITLGGSGNTNTSTYASIIGGKNNYLSSSPSATIIGSSESYLGQSSNYASMLGGYNLSIIGASDYASIIGGKNLDINTLALYSSLLGGVYNAISRSTSSSIIGGQNHNLFGTSSVIKGNVILGGSGNTLNNGIHSSIIGGNHNEISASEGSSDVFVLGGEFNMIDGGFNIGIVGGSYNTIERQADGSILIGGNLNYMLENVDRSVVIGGQNISASTNDTAYVPNLNINVTPSVDDSIEDFLVRDSDGTVKTRSLSSITSGATVGTGTTGTITIWDGTSTLGDSIITQQGTSGITVSGEIESDKVIVNNTGFAPLNLPVLPTSFTSSTHGDVWISSDSGTGTTLFKMVVSGITKAVQIS